MYIFPFGIPMLQLAQKSVMCTLDIFPPPSLIGEQILCEFEGTLVNDAAKHHEHTMAYPIIKIRSDIFRPSISREIAKDAFINQKTVLWRTVVQAWYENGFHGVLEEFSRNSSNTWSSQVANYIVQFVKKSWSWGNSFFSSFYPHLKMTEEEICKEFSSVSSWREGKVRAFVWHPQTVKCAVALQDDSVHVYNKTSSVVPVLKNKLQKVVMDLAWKPYCASVLAVACRSGVLLWQIDPTSVVTRPSSNCITLLSKRGHSPVSSVAWHPDGLYLVSACPVDASMLVWDVATETCVPLKRVDGFGVSLVRWSPDGERLFSATPSSLFRVWESEKWTYEKWTTANRCQAACWSTDGRTLLMATCNEPLIYSLSFGPSDAITPYAIGGCKAAIAVADLSPVLFGDLHHEIAVGGEIQDMIWDKTGQRLVVSFQTNLHAVAIFLTTTTPTFSISPCTFICGHHNNFVQMIKFHDNFSSGALLTIGWSSGVVQYVPLVFSPSLRLLEK